MQTAAAQSILICKFGKVALGAGCLAEPPEESRGADRIRAKCVAWSGPGTGTYCVAQSKVGADIWTRQSEPVRNRAMKISAGIMVRFGGAAPCKGPC